MLTGMLPEPRKVETAVLSTGERLSAVLKGSTAGASAAPIRASSGSLATSCWKSAATCHTIVFSRNT